MIDIHSHVIPMVDDGSKNFMVTERMLEEASKAGFKEIFATPHYFDEKSIKREDMLVHFNELKKLATSYGINLLLGNEVFVSHDLPSLVKDKVVSCMNDSRYLLFELPRNNDINYLQDVLFELSSMDIVPILAHPERYRFVIENPESLIELSNYGLLFQGNSGSILGDYGEVVKKTAITLLKMNIYQFLGSDAHSQDRYEAFNLSKKYVDKFAGEGVFEILTETNPAKVRDNLEVDIDIHKTKKSLFFWRK